MEVDGWADVEVRRIHPLPGVEVWIAPPPDQDPNVEELDPEDFASPTDYVQALAPGTSSATALPRPLSPGEPMLMWTLWAITDCDALVESQAPVVEFTTMLRTTRHHQMDDFYSPAFNIETLIRVGTGPAQ